ncbi:MAG TPA: hypothetical protein VF749_09415 [Candidatus Acidoferrum sp.]
METTDNRKANWSWRLSVVTDVQFCVRVRVLLVGLLLLRSMD